MKLLTSTLLLVYASMISAQNDPKQVGNCVTGKIGFNPKRILNNQANSSMIDVNKYDLTIDYGANNVVIGPDGVKLLLSKNGDSVAEGTRMSTTRYMLYGKFSVEMSAVPVHGIVVTFITMSERHDEIDWEFTGQHSDKVHSNVFYKGIQEFAIHNELLSVPGDGIAGSHVYTIDWKRDSLTWIIDGKPIRTLLRDKSISPMTPPGEKWYPSTPSKIQISIWDGGSSPNKGTSEWAGGPINWGSSTSFNASYKSIDIQCYDDKDKPVKSWPSQPEGSSIDFPSEKSVVEGSKVTIVTDNNGSTTSSQGGNVASSSAGTITEQGNKNETMTKNQIPTSSITAIDSVKDNGTKTQNQSYASTAEATDKLKEVNPLDSAAENTAISIFSLATLFLLFL